MFHAGFWLATKTVLSAAKGFTLGIYAQHMTRKNLHNLFLFFLDDLLPAV